MHAGAFRAYGIMPEQLCSRADNPIMMQRLDHWNASAAACVIGSRRDQWKNIMKMSHIRLFFSNDCADIAADLKRPE